jgi:putative hydrolase of the HAD superfamily
MRFPYLLFDAGETLIGPSESFGAVYSRTLAELGFERPAAVFDRALGHAWRTLASELDAGHDRYGSFPGGETAFWLRVVRLALAHATGDAAPPEGLAERALEPLRDAFRDPRAWTIYADVVPALDALRQAGVRMGIVSNWDSRLPALLDRLGLAGYFETMAVSALERVEKPHPEIFRRAMERMGADPERTLHVGDVPELDLDGARAAGLAAVIVDRRGRHDGAFPVILDFSALPHIVRHGL